MSHRRSRRPVNHSARKFALERLEPRFMLTTLVGGDVFEFIDGSGNTVRVSLGGTIEADFVAGVPDDQNHLLLTDLPGTFYGSDVGRAGTEYLGGVGALDGSTPVTLNDAAGAPMYYGNFNSRGAAIDFQAIASNTNGETWGFNVSTPAASTTNTGQAWLTQLNNSTGRGTNVTNLTSKLPASPGSPGDGSVMGITAAAFDPNNANELYFVVVFNQAITSGGGGGGTSTTTYLATPQLFKLDITNPSNTVTAIPGTFGVTTTDNARYPTGLAFDPNNHDLIAFMAAGVYVAPNATDTTTTGGGGTTGTDTPSGRLVTVPLTDTNGTGTGVAVRTTVDDKISYINNITGVSFIPGDTSLDTTKYILGVENAGNDSQLVRINRSSGQATAWGGVIDTHSPGYPDSDNPVRGADLQDLAWNPELTDPFTGQKGALLGSDGTTDDLMFIDYRLRPPEANIYHINVIHSDPDAYISIAKVATYDPEAPTPRDTDPFDGNAGAIRYNDLQTNTSTTANPGDGSGVVFIGARTQDLSTTDPYDDSIPLMSGTLGASIGSTLPGTITPGLVVSPTTITDFASANTNLPDRLLGANLNNIQAVAAGPDDHIAVIDSDLVDADGHRVNVDELALVNPVSGVAYFGAGVYDKNTSKELSGVKAMAYGDLNGDGTLELYAVYNINSVLTLGSISEDMTPATPGNLPPYGAFTTIAALGAPIDTNGIEAMAFTADGQSLYIVDGNGNLLHVNPTTGAVISNIGVVKDASTNDTLKIKSMDFDADGTLYAQDFNNARLVDINLTTAKAGGVSATPKGSLPQTTGAIAYDSGKDFLGVPRNRFVAVDNAWGSTPEQAASSPSKGSALMAITGTTADASQPQNLGKFLVGGALTGKVNISGSIGTFYAGSLLTGNARGVSPGSSSSPNFITGGDINQLVVYDSIGTLQTQTIAPTYLTGFNMQVGGVAGGISAGNTIAGSVDAKLNVADSGFDHYQYELESSEVTTGGDNPEGGVFQYGLLNDAFFVNNSFETPQYLAGSASDPSGAFDITVVGSIDNTKATDFADYYAVALMGGQTVAVQLSGGYLSGVNVGVFDPDGRLIATDYNDTSPQSVNGQPFEFTADRPGLYRFAVGTTGDVNFNDNGAGGGNNSLPSGQSTALATGYTLRIYNAGALGLGAVVAGENIINPKLLLKSDTVDSYHTSGADFKAEQGDVGAIVAGGTYYSQTLNSVAVNQGNLRAIVAGNLGNGHVDYVPTGQDSGSSVYTGPGSDPYLYVPNGSVGLVKTTGALMAVNTGFSATNANQPVIYGNMSIGGFYQEINAADVLSSNFVANQGFGNVLANFIAGGSLTANADNVGMDGIIDLIDAPTLSKMAIYTGPGGNVRYIVSDNVTRDPFFGGGLPDEETDYDPGQVVQLLDDSGSTITITPQITGTNTFYDPRDPFGSGPYTGTAITGVVTYGIRGSGGSALVNFTADGQFNIKADANGSDASAEIGTIHVTGGSGTPVTIDSDGNPVFAGEDAAIGDLTQNPNVVTQGLNIGIGGSAQVDVLGIDAAGLSVDNINSNGELPSVVAGTIGGLAAKRLGIAPGHWGTNVNPSQLLSGTTTTDSGTTQTSSGIGDVYPFNQQRTGIQSGNIISASAKEALGNFMVNGTIGSLTANSDGSDNASVFEGIVGPIVVTGTGMTSGQNGGLVYTSGSINNVQIGEGIRSAGSGAVSFGGLYAQNHIGNVRNQGAGSDVRGAIVAGNNISSIVLNNGSLIGASVLQITPSGGTTTSGTTTSASDYSTARQGPYSTISGRLPATVGHVNQTIGEVRTPGNGGIIGTEFIGADIGPISAPGFGILGSSVNVVISGTIGKITAGGYGVRAVSIYGGSSTGLLSATGDGSEIGTNAFGASVRQSEIGLEFDPYSGLAIGPMNDIDSFLGTSAATPIIVGVTETGLIQNVSVVGSRDFNGSKSWQIQNATYNFANSIGSVSTISTITNLKLTTGKLGTFAPGSDVFGSTLVIAGPVGTIRINGSLTAGSIIWASGPNGRISNVNIANDLNGGIWATQRIGTITVGRNIAGTINIVGNGRTGGSLGSLFIGGTLSNGSLEIYGNVGTITSAGSLGQSGDDLSIYGSIQKLQVRGDLRANVSVTDTAQTLDIWGSILSGVTVGVDNTIGALLVGGDTQAGSTIRARILKRIKVVGANMATYQIG